MNSDPLNDQTPQRAPRVRPVEIAAGIVMTAALLWAPWLWVRNENIQSLAHSWWNHREDQFVAGWKSYDREVLAAAGGPDGGNATLHILALNPLDPGHTDFAQVVLCRGSYALYPRRIFAADESTVLNGGTDAITARFNPSLQWLRAHDVRGILDGSPNASGTVVARIQMLPPPGADP